MLRPSLAAGMCGSDEMWKPHVAPDQSSAGEPAERGGEADRPLAASADRQAQGRMSARAVRADVHVLASYRHDQQPWAVGPVHDAPASPQPAVLRTANHVQLHA